MKSLLKEPLLHFLLIGAALFAAYGLLLKPGSGERGEIIVTQGQVDALAAGFARTWQRSPNEDELAGLIRTHVREEVYAREAVAMGLDRDDPIIRRRLQQKLEFITNDLVTASDASDAELNAYLQAHPEKFREEARLTFRQVYLNPARHRGTLERDANQLLAQLNSANSKIDPANYGDATMLEHSFVALRRGEVASIFGEAFAAKVEELATGQWQGPIESGYGTHLVIVSERTAGHLPELANVRDVVQREWQNARRLEANEKFYQELLSRYTIKIEDREVNAARTAATSK
jgi:hypothetical protein